MNAFQRLEVEREFLFGLQWTKFCFRTYKKGLNNENNTRKESNEEKKNK